jgi:hypothetical protein
MIAVGEYLERFTAIVFESPPNTTCLDCELRDNVASHRPAEIIL